MWFPTSGITWNLARNTLTPRAVAARLCLARLRWLAWLWLPPQDRPPTSVPRDGDGTMWLKTAGSSCS